jgi:hypothetical protein
MNLSFIFSINMVSCIVFGRSQIQISDRRPVILIKDFRGFPQSVQTNAGIIP